MNNRERIDWKQVLNEQPWQEKHGLGEMAKSGLRKVQDWRMRRSFRRRRNSQSQERFLFGDIDMWRMVRDLIYICFNIFLVIVANAYTFLWVYVFLGICSVIHNEEKGAWLIVLWIVSYPFALGIVSIIGKFIADKIKG